MLRRLLTADMSQLSSRLLTMKLAAGSAAVDVIKIVEDHPSLLLQQNFILDEEVCATGTRHCAALQLYMRMLDVAHSESVSCWRDIFYVICAARQALGCSALTAPSQPVHHCTQLLNPSRPLADC